jgi:lysophospholipase L1-like esterase
MNPLLLPIVAVQGIRVRRTTEAMPPAAGPRTGRVGDPAGEPLRVGVVGESTAAGCGVDRHDQGFAGALARDLSARTGRPVEWHVVGQDGATARRIRYRLLPQLGDGMDVAVLLAGVNDVLTRRAPSQWAEDLEAIVRDLVTRADRVVVAGLPPFGAFPAMPATLRRYLAERAAALDEVSRQVCARQQRARWVGAATLLPAGPGFFAADNFHPSAIGYRYWARMVATQLPSWQDGRTATGR